MSSLDDIGEIQLSDFSGKQVLKPGELLPEIEVSQSDFMSESDLNAKEICYKCNEELIAFFAKDHVCDTAKLVGSW